MLSTGGQYAVKKREKAVPKRLDAKKAAPLPATSLGPSPSLKFLEESGILPTDQGRPCGTGHLESRLQFGR
ncbi:hypothetical protein CapIbe_000871 [Capra ibex]